MNNKIIWKDIDSSTIKGLLICELPPITKPKMRVQETTVDGVDGSIIEDLGYETYDKSIRIGLTRDYDIDEVIKYFTGEGNIVFSNEPNKYYKAKIIEQIDYTRLLRFKEAEVKFRIQPFKYEYQEEEQNAETGSVEGTTVKITDAKATEIKIDGRSTQDGTPTPDTPVEIKSVGYENIFNPSNVVSGYTSDSDGSIKGTAFSTGHIEIEGGKKYYILSNKTSGNWGAWYDENKNYISGIALAGNIDGVVYAPLSAKYMSFTVSYQNNNPDYANNVMIVKSDKKLPYIPYGKSGFEVKTVGRNIWDEQWELGTINANTGEDITATARIRSKNFINVKSDTKYYGRIPSTVDNCLIVYYDNAQAYIKSSYIYSDSYEFTTPSKCKYIKFTPASNYGTTYNNNICINISDDKNGEYTPYKGNTSVIPLNAPLRSLPNGVKDIAYIKNNKLYVDRYIGSVILNGSENWEITTLDNAYCFHIFNNSISNMKVLEHYKKSNYFKYEQKGYKDATTPSLCENTLGANNKLLLFKTNGEQGTTVEEFKTWLSTHNTQVDYELVTPVTEELGDITIIQLLDGENNISNSEDANMVIDYVETLIINNLGNYISKPTFEIEGAGNIVLKVNDYSVFSYNFDEDGRVVIDSEKEDAYLGSVLKNRNMNGEFPKLEIGENKITWDGIVKNIKAVKKSRWL